MGVLHLKCLVLCLASCAKLYLSVCYYYCDAGVAMVVVLLGTWQPAYRKNLVIVSPFFISEFIF